MKRLIIFLAVLLTPPAQADGVVVIGHGSVPPLDLATVQKIYTGKVIIVDGQSVAAVNAKVGLSVRNVFLRDFLNQDDEKYVAYWTVRRFIGKGVPPPELASVAEIIRHVRANPGAIAYINETDLEPGMNVVARR